MWNRILVLGSSNVDFVLRVPRFAETGETITGANLETALGGKGANQAMAIRKLEGRVSFMTKLGNDQLGRTYRQYLVQNGMNPKYLLRDARTPTGVAFIEVGPRGENKIVVSPGSNGTFSVRDLKSNAAAWKGIRAFVTQFEIPLPAVRAGLIMARQQGAVTLLNPSPAFPLPVNILSMVDFIVPNEREAEVLSGVKIRSRGDLPRIAGCLLEKGVGNVVITLGDEGVFFKNREREIRIQAIPVKAVDTTAAGDAFMGALACGIVEGKSIREALGWANAAGALATTKMGAQPSLPRRRVLGKFFKNSGKA
jgi:ribokinase